MFEAAGLDGRIVALLGLALSFLGGCLCLGLQSRMALTVDLKRYIMLGLLVAIVAAASLLSTWLVVYRTPPFEAGIKSGLWMSGLICLVSVTAWQFFWFIIRRNLNAKTDQRAFFKVVSSIVFLAMCVGISAALIQDGTRHPNPNTTGPGVSIYTDGATSALILVDIADFSDENRLWLTNLSTSMRNTKPTPADNPYARVQWGLRLTGAPNGTARFAFIASPGAIDENPVVVGATQPVSKLITPDDFMRGGSRGTSISNPCKFEGSPGPGRYRNGTVLVTGSVHLDAEGMGAIGVTKREHRSWAEAGGSINTVRLPRVEMGAPGDCARGTGDLAGMWQAATDRTLSMTVGVSELEFAKVEAFPKPTFKSQTDQWNLGFAWDVSEKTVWNALVLDPYYTIESPGTKDRATFTLFVAAVLLGASITVLFEMIRDIPSPGGNDPTPKSLPSGEVNASTPALAAEASQQYSSARPRTFRISSRPPLKRSYRKR